MNKQRVLVLSKYNAARSQMLEAFLKIYGSDYFHVYSAGTDPQGVHPLAVEAMGDMDVDIRRQQSVHLDDVLRLMNFDIVITLCNDVLPELPQDFIASVNEHLHWHFDDPAMIAGDYEAQLMAFHAVRNTIQQTSREWIFNRVQH